MATEGKTPWCTTLPRVQQDARHMKRSKVGMINTGQEGLQPRSIWDTSPKASTKEKAKQWAGEETRQRGSVSAHLSCTVLFYRISRSSHRASSTLKLHATNGTFALWVFVFKAQSRNHFFRSSQRHWKTELTDVIIPILQQRESSGFDCPKSQCRDYVGVVCMSERCGGLGAEGQWGFKLQAGRHLGVWKKIELLPTPCRYDILCVVSSLEVVRYMSSYEHSESKTQLNLKQYWHITIQTCRKPKNLESCLKRPNRKHAWHPDSSQQWY